MPSRFTYSRWDGTQVGFELGADDVFSEITDDLLYHGDLNAALRRMLQSGFRDRNGERIQGIREMLEKLRRKRKDELERYDLGGVYDDIAQELRDVIDMERAGLDELAREAQESGDARRQEITDEVVQERNLRLDMLPPDLAGQVKDLQEYEFTSSEAREKFEQLVDQLRQQLMQSYFNQMAGAMSDVSEQDMARMKDMLADLNDLLQAHQAGEDTTQQFEEFMQRHGDFFPENPQNVEELLEAMAQRMAAMQALMNSMTPEQRAQLQGLAESLLEDMDLRWQMDQLSQNLQQMFPGAGWGREYDFSGQDPLGMAEAAQLMNELGDIDQLENLLSGATQPGALAEVDIDRARDLLGDDAARSLDRLAELAKMLEEAGLIEQREGRYELTPAGIRKIGRNALSDIFQKLAQDKMGKHEIERTGAGHERAYETKPYEFGDPFNLDIERTVRNAIGRQGSGTPVRLTPDDFEVERTEHLVRSSTVLMVDLSLSMPMRDNFLAAKKVAMALHSLISTQFPRRLPRHRRLQRGGAGDQARGAARGLMGLRVRHQHAARLPARPPDARPPVGHEADHHDHRRRADRPHHRVGRAVVPLPADPRDDRRDAHRGDAVHQGGHPHQHVHARRDAVPAELHREAHADEPGPRLLHDPRDPGRLRARRLHRAAAPALAGAPRVVTEPFDLEDTVVHVGLGSTLKPFGDWTWDQETLTRYAEATAGDGAEGRMVTMGLQAESWPTWERHPAGEELVLLLEGHIDLIQEIDGEEVRTSLRAGQAVINPPGVWHTADVHEPGRGLFITPGAGTEHKPR